MTGLELIATERQEQLEKHGISIEDDVIFNEKGQLVSACQRLLLSVNATMPSVLGTTLPILLENPPLGWNKHIWKKLCNKEYKSKLAVIGAWIAAELDRQLFIEQHN